MTLLDWAPLLFGFAVWLTVFFLERIPTAEAPPPLPRIVDPVEETARIAFQQLMPEGSRVHITIVPPGPPLPLEEDTEPSVEVSFGPFYEASDELPEPLPTLRFVDPSDHLG